MVKGSGGDRGQITGSGGVEEKESKELLRLGVGEQIFDSKKGGILETIQIASHVRRIHRGKIGGM